MSQLTNVKIQLRNDYLSNWIASDPVLHEGEIAIVIDEAGNENIKIGNGLSSFTQLKYLNQNIFKSDLVQAKDIVAKSIMQGYNNSATPTSLATGIFTEASANFGVVHGIEARILSSDDYAFVWNGVNLPGIDQRYVSHGEGTFSINPANGLSGIYIGNATLAQILKANADSTKIDDYTTSAQVSTITEGYGYTKTYVDGVKADLSACHISLQEYSQLLKDHAVLSNVLYVISSENADVFGERIMNVADPIELSDATNKKYVDDLVSNEISSNLPTKVSQLSNDAGYISAHQSLSDYYVKTEVSSASELSDKFNGIDAQLVATNQVIAAEVAARTAADASIESKIPVNVSQLANDAGYLTAHQSLSDYYTKAQANALSTTFRNGLAATSSLTAYETKDAHKSDVNALSNAISSKITVDGQYADSLHVRNISYEEYAQLIKNGEVLSNCIYEVSSENMNVFGERIMNVAEPIELSDAATKGYVDNAISSIPAPDLSNYVKMSSDVEQKISSDIYVKGWVKVGNLSVGSSTPKSEWGWITGDIERQKDLKSKFDYAESEIADIKTKIPNEATSDNQLADKDFVNSSIVTNTAYFKGTYDSVEELPTTRVTPNDYAFVIRNDEVGQTFYDRYKFTADGEWLFEYSINNSGFTAAQFATINSGVTSSLVQKYNGYESQIAQKANASSLTSYYTKSEVDAKIPAVPTLAGMTFDFSSNATIYESLSALITKLGGTVTNMPEKTSGYNVYVDANYMYDDPTIHKFSFDGGKTFMNSGQLNSYKGQLVASNLQPGEFQFWDDTGMGFNYHFEGEPAQSRVFNSSGLRWMVFPNDNNLNVYIDYSTV